MSQHCCCCCDFTALHCVSSSLYCLQCFDAVGWVAGRASEWWGAGVVICLELGADLHMAQLMPLPLTVSCFSKIQIVFTFLVRAHLGSPGQRAVKRVCVCVCVCVCSYSKLKTSGLFPASSSVGFLVYPGLWFVLD